jgi:hypothetical protein
VSVPAVVRSRVFGLAKLRASIPGPAGERSTLVLKQGTCDVKLAMPVPPNEQAPTRRMRSTSSSPGAVFCFTTAGAPSTRATCCS